MQLYWPFLRHFTLSIDVFGKSLSALGVWKGFCRGRPMVDSRYFAPRPEPDFQTLRDADSLLYCFCDARRKRARSQSSKTYPRIALQGIWWHGRNLCVYLIALQLSSPDWSHSSFRHFFDFTRMCHSLALCRASQSDLQAGHSWYDSHCGQGNSSWTSRGLEWDRHYRWNKEASSLGSTCKHLEHDVSKSCQIYNNKIHVILENRYTLEDKSRTDMRISYDTHCNIYWMGMRKRLTSLYLPWVIWGNNVVLDFTLCVVKVSWRVFDRFLL